MQPSVLPKKKIARYQIGSKPRSEMRLKKANNKKKPPPIAK
jgi:hypothetical protein